MLNLRRLAVTFWEYIDLTVFLVCFIFGVDPSEMVFLQKRWFFWRADTSSCSTSGGSHKPFEKIDFTVILGVLQPINILVIWNALCFYNKFYRKRIFKGDTLKWWCAITERKRMTLQLFSLDGFAIEWSTSVLLLNIDNANKNKNILKMKIWNSAIFQV